MKHLVTSQWDLILVRGILAILFGTATLLMPGITLIALVALFGAYALIDGLMLSVIALKGRQVHANWWLLLLAGLSSIAVSIMTVVWPDITAKTLLYLIAAWAIVTGGFEVVYAIRFRKVLASEGLLVLDGILSIIFGSLLIAQPGAGALAVLWLIGMYAIAYGVMLVVLAFRLRKFEATLDAHLGQSHAPQS